MLSLRGDNVASFKIMWFSVFNQFTFQQLQWIIPVTSKQLSEQREGGLKCCAMEKPWKEISNRTNVFCDSIR